MKKTFKFFAAALAIVAAASCAKEVNVDTPADDSADKVFMTFTASYETEGETKAVLADGNFVHWSDTDAIRIFGKNADGSLNLGDESFAIDPSSNDDDPTFAIFSGTGVPYSINYAVLPANGWDKYNTYMCFSEGLGHQTAVKNSFDPTKHIAISSEATSTHFSFYNECALLKVKIGSDGIYSVKVDGMTGKKTFGIDNTAIGMMLQYTPGKIGKLSVNHVTGLSQSIILANSDPSKALESGATYYIVVPYGDFGGFKVAICDLNGNELVSKSKASRFNIERNKVYDLGTFEKPAYQLQVGDYYYSDGTTGVEYKSNAVGVVFYVGKPQDVDPTIPGGFTKGLVVGLKEYSNLYFGTENDGNTSSLHPDNYGVNTYASSKAGANAVLDAASKNIIGMSRAYEMTVKHAKKTGGSELYSSYNFGTNSYGSGWMIPSAKEYSLMYKNINVLNSKDQFTDLQVWTSSDKSENDESLGEYVIGYHTIWQANINGEAGWRCLNYYYIDSSREGVVQVVSNTNSRPGSKGHIGRAIFAF